MFTIKKINVIFKIHLYCSSFFFFHDMHQFEKFIKKSFKLETITPSNHLLLHIYNLVLTYNIISLKNKIFKEPKMYLNFTLIKL